MTEGSVKGRYNALRLKHLGINAYRENILYLSMDVGVVHPIFAGITSQTLIEAGAERVVSCNTIPHESNQMDLSQSLTDALTSHTSSNPPSGH